MKKVVVLTGSGISAESGLKTFRGMGGLWEGYKVTDVATPQAFAQDPELVLKFYNERRHQGAQAEANLGHKALVDLEQSYDVSIITQNVDNLHEKAGSSHILHLHGELLKKRSSYDPDLIEDWPIGTDIVLGDLAPDGGQWRPHIVWFGEDVPMMYEAAQLVAQADIFLIVGTSLVVYPAASLVGLVPTHAPIYVVDPEVPDGIFPNDQVNFIQEKGSIGVPMVVRQLLDAEG